MLAIAGTAWMPVQAAVVPAWTASPQPVWPKSFFFPSNIPANFGGRTVRQVVHLGIGGRNVRIVLSNAYGHQPVTIMAAHVAPSTGGSRIDPAKDHVLRFGSRPGVTLLPGRTAISDPLPVSVRAGEDIAVSFTIGGHPKIGGFHWDARRTAYVLADDQIAAADPKVAASTTVRLFLSQVLVDNAAARGTVVALGDSITDGAGAKMDSDARWPDFLAARAAPRGIAVVNAGISGARLLSDGMGDKALARLDRDVLRQPDVRTLILLLGINDIAWPGTVFDPHGTPANFDRLVAGYRALVARAHARGVRVIAGTLMPFAGALPGTPMASTYYSPAKDALRRRVNAWIRTSHVFDGVVDFDRLLADPKAPARLLPAYDSGDHLHPGNAGDRAMAQAIDLDTLVQPRR